MPAFVIVHGFERIGQTDAIICDPSPVGVPDRKTATPVRVRLLDERTLSVDGEICGIISNVGENGVSTILVNSSTRSMRDRERRAALAKASTLLQQLTSCLEPLATVSDDPALAMEALGMLFDWLNVELVTPVPRSMGVEGARNGPARS
jgi:hypothetical protein